MQYRRLIIEVIIALTLIITALLASLYPTLYYLTLETKDTVFPLIHNNHPDYYFYLNLMHQGLEGNWLVTSRFTPELFPPQLIQTFFILLGHLARIISVSLPLIYTLSRVILGFSVGIAVYILLFLFDKRLPVRITGLVFTLFGSSFWLWQNKQIVQFLSYWTAFDARERTTYLPHHLFSILAIIISLIFLTIYFKSEKNKYFIFASVVSILGVIVNPKIMANFFFAVGILFAYFFLTSKKYLKPILFYLVLSSLPYIYFLKLEKNVFPWTTYNLFDKYWVFSFGFMDYALAMGPVFILSLFGIREIFRRRDFLSMTLFFWYLVPFIGIFLISNLFGYGNVFFFHSAHYIPIAFIGALGFINVIRFLSKKLKIKSGFIFTFLFVASSLYFSVSWYGSIKQEISRFTPNIFNIFLPKEFFQAFDYLNKNSKAESVVLSEHFLGTIIPAFTYNRVVIGHPANTFQYQNKKAEVSRFFSQTDIEFAKELIRKYRISYVFYTFDTGQANGSYINRLGLTEVYRNPTVTIFRTAGR